MPQNKTIQKRLLKNCSYELSLMAFKDIVAWPEEVIKLFCLLKIKMKGWLVLDSVEIHTLSKIAMNLVHQLNANK